MRYGILYITCLLMSTLSFAQECPNLLDPIANSTNVSISTEISWEEVVGVTGYIVSIGTTSGGTDIVNEQAVGSDTSFTPPVGLPESSQIFVTITLFFFDQPDIVCPSQSFFTENVTTIPTCSELTSPLDGAQNVNIATNLNWSYAPRAIGYRLTLGTAPGLGDIIDNLDVGNVLFFNPTVDFPINTQIFVLIIPYNENGNATSCPEESFTTASLGDPPGCTQLITPLDGAINVALSPLIEWVAIPEATGYIVNMGRSPFVNDVLDNAVFTTNSTFVLNFEPNSTYFIQVIPFNEAGEAQDCGQESFSTILGCGPFIDEDTGELVVLNPEINFPDEVGICENEVPTRITTPDIADGFRWYQILPTGSEELISIESFVDISETGPYRYEAYNVVNQEGESIECPSTKEFTVNSSSAAVIESLGIVEDGGFFTVTVNVSGNGDYEFSLNDPEGIYNDDNVIVNLNTGTYTVYVRDKKGCGIVEREFKLALAPPGFPPYFSPNGDGINDFWQYVPPLIDPLPLTRILIFDRFGKLLIRLNPNSEGWDGSYNGSTMPSDGYWYKAFTSDNRVISGNFSIAR